MAYNSLVSRTDVAGLIPVVTANEILNRVAQMNPIMQVARRLPNMPTGQVRMPVISSLASAYFVSGDTGLKQTSEVNWQNKFIDAEELAVIVPIAQAVLDDSSFDIWAAIRPELEAAFSVAISQAVLYGTNIPASWTTNLGGAGLLATCTAAGHTLSLAGYIDLYEALLGETAGGVDGVWMSIEADGFMVNGTIAHPLMKGLLRNTRDKDGNPMIAKLMGEERDAHGNLQLSGTGALGDLLSQTIKDGLKLKRVRSDTYGYLQRCFIGCRSDRDAHEAREVGEKAVQYAMWDNVDGSIAIRRPVLNYSVDYELVPIEKVAGKTRHMPDNFINADANGVTEDFLNYCRPLLGSDFPQSHRLRAPMVPKILHK
jgi:hypothetical protein